jgi:hypothetical protein
MAYSGTTALSSVSNPPICLIRGIGGSANTTAFGSGNGAPGLWVYTSSHSATEASSGSNSGAFFSDAYSLGMRTGDVMMMVGNTGSSIGFAIGSMTVTTALAYLSTGSQANSTGGS